VNHIARRFVISDWGGIETAILNLCRKSLVHNDEVKILSTLALKKDKKKI
jgi:hypothetical protein